MGINDQALNLPKYPIDRIIGILKDDLQLTASKTFNIPTGIDDTTLLQGVFSVNYSGQYQPFVTTTYLNDNLTTGVQLWAASTPGYVYLNASVFGPCTVSYRICLLAKKDQKIIKPLNIDYETSLTSETNYRKILKEDVVLVTVPAFAGGTAGRTTIPYEHNLGHNPTVEMYAEDLDNQNLYPTTLASLISTAPGVTINCIVDTKKVRFEFYNSSSEAKLIFHYQVFYEQH